MGLIALALLLGPRNRKLPYRLFPAPARMALLMEKRGNEARGSPKEAFGATSGERKNMLERALAEWT